ncbi:hypothetical protein EV401DRAFT_1908716 [Pisolithus croceorrhizus]|nr:hypothetical protein EV401DRAFT_1908716 [Pisolithus croceorrhizus]
MFGLDYLQKLVGEITFFERLPSIMQALRRGEPSVDDGSPTCLSSLSSVSSESWDSLDYVDLLSEWKGPRYETGTVHDVLRLRRDDAQYSLIKKEAKQHDLEFISVSLSTKLLEFVYVLSSEKWGDGQALVHSTVQEVEALRTRLEATADDDEQRALEEDITGQILWFYWCGICSEVNDRLRSLAYDLRDRRDEAVPGHVYEDKDEYDDHCWSSWGLYNSAKFKRTLHVGPANNVADLQRIMFDAGAGVSKHKLWLAARASGEVVT